MSEEGNVSVPEEIQEASAQATESNDAQQSQATAEKKQRDDQAYNWAEARRKMQELEKQNRELAEQVQKINKGPSPEEDYGIADDALAEGRHLKELRKELSELKSVLKQKEISSIDDRLAMKFSDFKEIVNEDNLKTLIQTEPELAESVLTLKDDPYKQGIAAYKLMKRVGIGSQDKADPERERALKNSQKPVSVNAVTKQSAIGNVHHFENGLTPALKKQLWAEMEEARKRA